MTQDSREKLQRAAGILEGLSVSGDLSDAATNMIVNVSEMINDVLKKEGAR